VGNGCINRLAISSIAVIDEENYAILKKITTLAAITTFFSKSYLQCCGQFPKESPRESIGEIFSVDD
jgi:hypothetical protein